jgi:hypothetical protein
MEEAQKRQLPASGGAGAAPPPKTTAPAISWRLTLHIALGVTWHLGRDGWWRVAGATGRANCVC